MALPDTLTVEVEFTSGAWTDVTTDVNATDGIQVHVGRATEFDYPQASSIIFRLNNVGTAHEGYYTPNNPASPYYPNITMNMRVRLTITDTAVTWQQIFYVDSWQPEIDTIAWGKVTVVASDRFKLLARAYLQSSYVEACLADSPAVFIIPSGSGWGTYGDQDVSISTVSNSTIGTGSIEYADADWELDAGRVELNLDESNADANAGEGYKLRSNSSTPVNFDGSAGYSQEFWFKTSESTMTEAFIATWTDFDDRGAATEGANKDAYYLDMLTFSGDLAYLSDGGTTISYGTRTGLNDGEWHHVVATWDTSANQDVWIDGVLDRSGAPTGTYTGYSNPLLLIGTLSRLRNHGAFRGSIGPIATYPSLLSESQIVNHYNIGVMALETVDERIARVLDAAGVPTGEQSLDPSAVSLSVQDWEDRTALDIIQEATAVDGGVTSVEVGNVTFRSSLARATSAVDATFDVDLDLNGSVTVAFEETLANESSAAMTGGPIQRYKNETAQAAQGRMVDDLGEGPYSSDEEAMYSAQYRVAQRSTPTARATQYTVDSMANGSNYVDVLAMRILDRHRLTNLPAGLFPGGTQVDVIVQGYSFDIGIDRFFTTVDASPADLPPESAFDDTMLGRFVAETGAQTVNTTLLVGGTSLSLATSSGALFTTAAGDMPLYIQCEGEVMQVTAASGGASPQTLTVTRAQFGTTAKQHNAGAVVEVYQDTVFGR